MRERVAQTENLAGDDLKGDVTADDETTYLSLVNIRILLLA